MQNNMQNDTPSALAPLALAVTKASGWDGVTRALMLAGKSLPVADEALQNEANYVPGCDSDVWLRYDPQAQHWEAYSPSKIIRGVLAVILEKAEQHSPEELVNVNFDDYLRQIKLSQFVSESRANGIKKVIQRLQLLAQQHA